MDSATFLDIERAKASKKSPVVLWLGNIVWPGLGNMVVGQKTLGITFGLLHWLCILFAILTLGIGIIVCAINFFVASGVGHARINRDYAAMLQEISRPVAVASQS